MCILLDKDIIRADVKMNYNSSISQKSHVKDSKYIFKENTTLLFRLTDRRVSLRIMKNKNHAHTQVYKHTHAITHTYMQTHKDDACNVKTHACTRACARMHRNTHTKCSFVIGGPSLWNHLPHTVKEAGCNSLSRYLKRLYLVNLAKYRLVSEFITVPLTLLDLFVVYMVLNVRSHRTKLPFLHEPCMERSEK